ncbi:hypothetical protein M8998_03850 [Sphingobacterium sp. lm-10]|uniref:hypothetical protein n=1 Tax=Sphingobacterium sp. lm-10 TaxID=2944904 RepID=UPI002022238A|nr:hypothetical protein [Sphingobacterium sp. lm-10]MCL7987072.1 hypothetical protein [Sphingobacterium sp. lm-10]
MLRHLFPRLLIGAAALLVLALHTSEADKGGGNNGMGLKILLFVALGILLIEGLYLFGEMLALGYKTKYQLAAINLGLLAIGALVFLYLSTL